MNKTILLYIFLLWASLTDAQEFKSTPLTRAFSIHNSDHRIECRALIQKYDLKVEAHIEYFWIKNNKLQQNKGGFSGSLLHGDFNKYKEGGQLLEKGQFFQGMKNALWQIWNHKGELVHSMNYKKGVLEGEMIQYLSNGSVVKIPYRKGLIHGKKQVVSTDTIRVEKYRHGILIPEKVKSESTFKFKKLIFWKKDKNKSNEDSDKETVQSEA